VVGVDNNGCFAPATTTVTVNPGLSIIASSNSPLCAGATINLSANAGVTWSWMGPAGFNSTQQNPSIPNAIPSMSGTYTITATDANGCTGTATTNVVVNPLPSPTASSNSPVCVNGMLNLNAGGGNVYLWGGPNNFSSSQQNPTISNVTTAATGSYSVLVTDVNGCINTATVSVTITPLPVITASGATVCVNDAIQLTANNSGVNYQWSGPNGYSSNVQSPTIPNATTNMAGVYTVTVTDASTCSNTDTVRVAVNPLPVITAASATICKSASATLSASGASSYTWTPTSGLSSSTGSSVLANPSSTTSYTVTGSDANGCKSLASLTVTVNPLPAVNISPAVTSGCQPVCVTFTNTSSAGTYSWHFGDGSAPVTLAAPSHCYNTPGTYSAQLSVTDNNGCKDSVYSVVTVYPLPHADFYGTPQPTTILDPDIHFHDISSGSVITAWHWSYGDPGNHTSNLQNPSFTYGDAGSYTVQETVTSNYGCKDSITVIIKIDEDFTLYVPNAFSPNGDGVNDVFYAKGEGVHNFQMWIFDRWGNQVFYSDNIYKGWDGSFMAKGSEIVQQDVYVWKIEAKSSQGESHSLNGVVSLLK
jgi:gliding motility-associated-like protein